MPITACLTNLKNTKKILVTGASGGLAEFVIEELLRRRFAVIASARNHERVQAKRFYSDVKFIPYDLDYPSSDNLYTYFDQPDSIIHLAWDKLSEPKDKEHTEKILTNQKLFLFNLVENGLKDFNVIGTAYEFGLSEGIHEDEDECNPVVPYGIGKLRCKEFMQSLKQQYGFNFKWIRVFNVFNSGKSGKNLFSQLNQALQNHETKFNMSGGEQIRDYIDASTLGKWMVEIATQTRVQGAINCCSGKPVSLKDLVQTYLNKQGSDLQLNLGHYPYLDYEPMTTWGDTKKLDQILLFSNLPST